MIATRGGLAPPEAPFVIEHREALIYMLCEAAELIAARQQTARLVGSVRLDAGRLADDVERLHDLCEVARTRMALAAVDADQLKLLRTLDASRWQAFRYAELPAALPAAISGARIALAIGVIGAYIAESQTATSGEHAGLGHEINADLTALQTSRAYAAAVVLFAFAVACFYALTLAERRLAPWAVQSKGDIR